MESPPTPPTVTELQAELQKLREDIKEQQPGLIGAVRTLLIDWDKWRKGERDYPRAALLGVVFAYLRPRLTIVIGSIAAAILGVAQFWMLNRQNSLIEQQNRLIDGQSYALRAQTTAALLNDVDDERPLSHAQLAVLLGFGDIGYESLMLLAKENNQAGETARRALAEKISAMDESKAFDIHLIFLNEMKRFLWLFIQRTMSTLRASYSRQCNAERWTTSCGYTKKETIRSFDLHFTRDPMPHLTRSLKGFWRAQYRSIGLRIKSNSCLLKWQRSMLRFRPLKECLTICSILRLFRWTSFALPFNLVTIRTSIYMKKYALSCAKLKNRTTTCL
jgi:hypothetical protein